MVNQLPPPEAVVQLGGSAFRLSSRFSSVFLMPPDYVTYVAADADARVYREYNLATGELVRTVLGPEHYGPVSQPSSDGTRIATESTGGVRVVDITSARVILRVPTQRDAAFALAPTGDRLAVLIRHRETEQREADRDLEDVYICAAVVHEVGSGSAREFRPLANIGVTTLFSPDGRLLAVSGQWEEEYDDQAPPFEGSAIVQVWDVTTGAEVFRFVVPSGDFQASSFGGEFILINDRHHNRPFGLFHLTTGKLICEYAEEYPNLERAVLSPDGTMVVGIRRSVDLVRWEARTGAEVDVTPCPFKGTLSSAGWDEFTKEIAFRGDGSVLVLRVIRQVVEVWTAPDGRPVTHLLGGTVPITAIAFVDGGREVLTAGRSEAVVRRWNAQTGELLGETNLPDEVARYCVGRVRFGPADRLIVGSVLFHLATGKIRSTPRNFEEASMGESLSAEGWRVSLPTHVRNQTDVGVRLEHVVDGGAREIHRFDGLWAAAAYDRARVLLMYDDRRSEWRTVLCLRVDAEAAEVIWSRTLRVGPAHQQSYQTGIDWARVANTLSEQAVLWSPYGATVLAIPRRERVPFLLDAATGETLSAWTTAVAWPYAVHPSRPVLAAATADGDGLILADWRTGARLATIQERCYPHALAWSPDGSRLAASLPDGTARLYVLGSL